MNINRSKSRLNSNWQTMKDYLLAFRRGLDSEVYDPLSLSLDIQLQRLESVEARVKALESRAEPKSL